MLSTPEASQLSWIASLLPFMEQNGLAKSLDPRYGAYDPVNSMCACRASGPP